jgi:pimeloyl-ACP methyl ester carboxylesterase
MPDFFVPGRARAPSSAGASDLVATFVLIHGACHGGWCWERVVPILEAHGHKAHAPDLPGLGKDHTPPANVTLADNVEKISRLLDKIEEPVVLVGHALGGVTVSQVAEARRRKLRRWSGVCGLMPLGHGEPRSDGRDPDMLFRRSREVSPDGLTTASLGPSCRRCSTRTYRPRTAIAPWSGCAHSRSRSRPRR